MRPTTFAANLSATIESTGAACRRAIDHLGRGRHPAAQDVSPEQRRQQVEDFASSAESAARALAHLPSDDAEARVAEVRRALLSTALQALAALPHTRVPDAVKCLQCRLFLRFCEPADVERRFRPDLQYDARAYAKCALLERFVAGQFDWEVSGLPRSYILRMPPKDLPRVFRMIAFGLGGLKPCFAVHMGLTRYPLVFNEPESHRAYYQMALTMRLQPRIRGMLMMSWFHSPETSRVSPHLAWTNKTPLAHGALLTDIGPSSPGDGFLTSNHRRQLFESEDYRPRTGVVIWPRQAVLSWAAAHPEYGAEGASG